MIDNITENKLRVEQGKVYLCCGKNFCPSIQIVEGNVLIVDDDENCVTLTLDQVKAIPEALKKLMP